MREIKFRAWTGSNLGYSYNDDLERLFALKRIAGSGDPIIFEQFTGFHDKNGKEIYEGDIIKNCAGNSDKIIWHDGAFIIGEPDDEPDEIGNYYILLGECSVDCFEVIGNIHEATK